MNYDVFNIVYTFHSLQRLNIIVIISLILLFTSLCLDMDGRTSEARFELCAAKLVTDSVLAKNAHQTEFVSRQKWQNSS